MHLTIYIMQTEKSFKKRHETYVIDNIFNTQQYNDTKCYVQSWDPSLLAYFYILLWNKYFEESRSIGKDNILRALLSKYLNEVEWQEMKCYLLIPKR